MLHLRRPERGWVSAISIRNAGTRPARTAPAKRARRASVADGVSAIIAAASYLQPVRRVAAILVLRVFGMNSDRNSICAISCRRAERRSA